MTRIVGYVEVGNFPASPNADNPHGPKCEGHPLSNFAWAKSDHIKTHTMMPAMDSFFGIGSFGVGGHGGL